MIKKTSATLIALFVSSAALADSPFISNATKYKDTSLPNATGRSGDASIEARALLGKDGMTDLELTAAGGTLDRVQLKLPGGVTHNFNDLSGTSFAQRLSGLAPRDPLGVQVNVATPDRMGVVSATEIVKLRPDLMIASVSARPHTVIGEPFQVAAVIREANGDVGARASCVLLANGVEVDRANGIWVDAGGTVTCELAHTFRSAGTSQLSVAVTGVDPGDFDTANNRAAPVSVRVYERVSELEPWTASAQEQSFHRRYWFRTPLSEYESVSDGWSAGLSFWTMFYDYNLNVETLRASIRASTDGQVIHQIDDVQFEYETGYDWEEDIERQCSIAYLDPFYGRVTSCRVTTPWDGRRVSFSYNYHAGEITYVSRGWFYVYIGGGQYSDDIYYWNSQVHSQYGTPFRLGNTVALAITFSDGTNYFEARPVMELEPYGWVINNPDSCTPDGTWCSGYQDTTTGKGRVVGTY